MIETEIMSEQNTHCKYVCWLQASSVCTFFFTFLCEVAKPASLVADNYIT